MPELKERVCARSLMYISPLVLANTARFQSISHTWTKLHVWIPRRSVAVCCADWTLRSTNTVWFPL